MLLSSQPLYQVIYSLLYLGVACFSVFFCQSQSNNEILSLKSIRLKLNTNCHVLSVVHTQKTFPNGHLKLNQAQNIKKISS